MDKTLTELEFILKREEELHAQLLQAADDKRQAIVKGDLPGMERLLQLERGLIEEVARMEKERERTAAAVREQFGLSTSDGKMASLIAAVEEPHASRLSEVRQRLTAVLNKLRYRTRQNAELLKASVEHVNAFLRTVAGSGAPKPVYSRDGKKGNENIRLLDRQA